MDLKKTVLKVFEKFVVMMDPANIEDCHWIKFGNNSTKVTLKLLKRKDAQKYDH